MGDVIDLSGDGGVLKQIVRRAKPDAIAPSDDLPVVDGMLKLNFAFISFFDVVSLRGQKLIKRTFDERL